MPTKKPTRPATGGHVSAAGGLYKCVENAKALGAETIQIFGGSPRQWAPKMPQQEDFDRYKEARKDYPVLQSVYLHAPYLVNLGSPNDELIAKSIDLLAAHLAIVEGMGADGLIFHVGAGKDQSKEVALKKAAKAMKEVLKRVKGESRLIIENVAGGGSKIGATAEEVGTLMKLVDSPRVKVCVDTAHSLEAGIIEEYTPKTVKAFWNEWNKQVGLQNIVALHVNDSKTPFNSHHDRHENIGEGYIGIEGFRALAGDKRLFHAAWIMEVPGMEGKGSDPENLARLRSCFNQ